MKSYIHIIIISLLVCCSKSEEVSNSQISEADSLSAFIEQWSHWSERTAEGLWQDNPEHSIDLCLIDTIYGESEDGFNFYTCYAFTISGDSLFIVDHTVNQLVCMSIDGSLFWKYGGCGEGPGHFNCLNSVCVGSGWIAVGDAFASKIEILTRDGGLIRIITEQNPTALVTVNDTTFAVLSRISEGGDIHLYSVDSGYIKSYGYGNWEQPEAYWHLELFGTLLQQDSSIWIVSCLENKLYSYDLLSEATSDNYAKNYPTEILEPEQVEAGLRVYAIMGDIFIGPEGMVNVLLGGLGFTPDGKVKRSSDEERIPIEIIDRYNEQGQYLDSYCIQNETDYFNQIEYSSEYGYFCSVYNLGIILNYVLVDK